MIMLMPETMTTTPKTLRRFLLEILLEA